MAASVISLQGVAKSYCLNGRCLKVLRDFDLQIETGEFAALTGPSGVGKSTVLNLIGGLDHPDGGQVLVAQTALETLSTRQLARWRAAHVGFVFQSHNLLSFLTAAENIELPLLLKALPGHERHRRVGECLRQLGLADRSDHRPGQLSGGQQQRVGIGRAMIADAPILLCDEPTADLDRSTAEEILTLLERLTHTGRTVLMVTHDPECARRAHRQIRLEGGGA